MKNQEFLLRVERRMSEYNFEPTREQFVDWVNDQDLKVFSEERRTFLQQQIAGGKTLHDLTSELTEDEFFDWYWHLDLLIEETMVN